MAHNGCCYTKLLLTAEDTAVVVLAYPNGQSVAERRSSRPVFPVCLPTVMCGDARLAQRRSGPGGADQLDRFASSQAWVTTVGCRHSYPRQANCCDPGPPSWRPLPVPSPLDGPLAALLYETGTTVWTTWFSARGRAEDPRVNVLAVSGSFGLSWHERERWPTCLSRCS